MIHDLGQKVTFAGPQKACNTPETSPAQKLYVILNLISSQGGIDVEVQRMSANGNCEKNGRTNRWKTDHSKTM